MTDSLSLGITAGRLVRASKNLGNKNTTIREIGEVVSSMKDLFTERWNES